MLAHFSHCKQFCLRSSSYSVQGILMKLSSYCPHDLNTITFYQGQGRLIFTRVMVLCHFFNSKSYGRNSCFSVKPIFIKSLGYSCYHLTWSVSFYLGHDWTLLAELLPFVTLAKSYGFNSSSSFQPIFTNFSGYYHNHQLTLIILKFGSLGLTA